MAKIEMDCRYPQPPQAVWEALAQAEALSQWLMPTDDFRPEPGCRFHFRTQPMHGWGGVFYCELLAVEPPRRLAWRQLDEADSDDPEEVSLTLEPDGAGTRLHLSVEGFRGPRGTLMHGLKSQGWTSLLRERLPAFLDNPIPA